MKTWQRYWLFQLPGLALAGLLLLAVTSWFSLPAWAGALGFLLWLVKDILVYPYLKSAYEGPQPTGVESLVGAVGTATENLAPRGTVRVRAELWQAESREPVQAGESVRITGCRGMTVQVEAAGRTGPSGRPLRKRPG